MCGAKAAVNVGEINVLKLRKAHQTVDEQRVMQEDSVGQYSKQEA